MKTFRKIISIPLYLIGFWFMSMIAFTIYSGAYFPLATQYTDTPLTAIGFLVMGLVTIFLGVILWHKENKLLNYGRTVFVALSMSVLVYISYVLSYFYLIKEYLVVALLFLVIFGSMALNFHIKIKKIDQPEEATEGERLQ